MDSWKKKRPVFVMHCHDRIFQKVTVLNETGEKLFTAKSKGVASLSWRRTLKDVSGNPLFSLRKILGFPMSKKWAVESPSGREICSLKHVSFKQRQALDVIVRNEDDKGSEVTVEVRPKDQKAFTTLVSTGEACAAEIQLAEVNTNTNLDRSVWKARIAGGVDLTLIVAIMLCRAEMQHVWKL